MLLSMALQPCGAEIDMAVIWFERNRDLNFCIDVLNATWHEATVGTVAAQFWGDLTEDVSFQKECPVPLSLVRILVCLPIGSVENKRGFSAVFTVTHFEQSVSKRNYPRSCGFLSANKRFRSLRSRKFIG